MYYTTLNKIRSKSPCCEGWETLLKHLGKKKADDEPVSLKTIFESNGIEDAIWCLCAVDGIDREARLFAVWCARQVQHLMEDQRSIDALDIVEKFANGEAAQEELAAARAAAWDAAMDAAWDAARDAARAAARDAAWDAARDAAMAAARDAAWDAARDAAMAAARAAAWDAAWDAAMDAARDAQKEKFIEMFCQD